tara:strand:+ start:2547 stop:3788 length:1242 start_codon:yes stop_codon:yes gene_type:complete
MASDVVKFLFNKTIIKYVPKLQKEIRELKKKADKLKLPERNKIIYMLYHLDDPHVILTLDLNTYPINNFIIYVKLDNYNYKKYDKRYVHNIKNYKYYIHTNTKFDGDEILEIDNMKPYDWMNSLLKSYDYPCLNKNIITNLHINWEYIKGHIKINNFVLKNKGICHRNELKWFPQNTLKHKPFIVKKINTKILYIKIGAFKIYDKTNCCIDDLDDIRHKLKPKLLPVKYYRDKNIVVDIRGSDGGNQETAYPFIEAIFGEDIEELLKQKKQMKAIDYSINKPIEIIDKQHINYNVVNKFTGKLFILMNYNSWSMNIIFISWLKYLKSKFNIDITFIGTAIGYQRKLSNTNITKQYKKYNLKIFAPSRYIYKHGIKNTDIVFTPDYYYDNMKKPSDHLYPEQDIPIDFIKKLIK